MEDITTEKKLQLIQQIRTQHNRNQYDMSNREQILYGKSSAKIMPFSYGNTYHDNFSQADKLAFTGTDTDSEMKSESLKFRCAVAAIFFIFAVVFDLFGVKPAGMEMRQIFEFIAADYKENVQEFVQTISAESVLQK